MRNNGDIAPEMLPNTAADNVVTLDASAPSDWSSDPCCRSTIIEQCYARLFFQYCSNVLKWRPHPKRGKVNRHFRRVPLGYILFSAFSEKSQIKRVCDPGFCFQPTDYSKGVSFSEIPAKMGVVLFQHCQVRANVDELLGSLGPKFRGAEIHRFCKKRVPAIFMGEKGGWYFLLLRASRKNIYCRLSIMFVLYRSSGNADVLSRPTFLFPSYLTIFVFPS